MFIDAYEKICKEKGVAPTSVLAKLGISKSAYSGWQKGNNASIRTKKQLADYFDISIDELEKGQIKKPDTKNGDGLSADESYMLSMYRQLSEDQKAAFDLFLLNVAKGK